MLGGREWVFQSLMISDKGEGWGVTQNLTSDEKNACLESAKSGTIFFQFLIGMREEIEEFHNFQNSFSKIVESYEEKNPVVEKLINSLFNILDLMKFSNIF